MNSGTKAFSPTIIGGMPAAATALVLSTVAFAGEQSLNIHNNHETSRVSQDYVTRTYPSTKAIELNALRIINKGASEGYIDKAARLRGTFGFKVNDFIQVMEMSRSNWYKWINKPGTEVSPVLKSKIDALDALADVMEDGHAQYLGQAAFGFEPEEGLVEALIGLTSSNVNSVYDDHYFALEGMYKRSMV